MIVRGFDWDDDFDSEGNTYHIVIENSHRNITQLDVESVFDNDPLWLPEPSDGPNPYYTVIGRDRKGRLLEVHGAHFQRPRKTHWFRPETAFEARAKFQKRYFDSGRR